jgi:hypothetical protein
MSESDVVVILNFEEAHAAAIIGLRRELKNQWQAAPDLTPPPAGQRDGYENHIRGAMAELAVAKWAGSWWSGLATDARERAIDVTPNIETRHARHGGPFYVKARDPNTVSGTDDPIRMVWVTGGPRTFRLEGWAFVKDCKRPEWQAFTGVYAVPQNQTQSMHEWHNGKTP